MVGWMNHEASVWSRSADAGINIRQRPASARTLGAAPRSKAAPRRNEHNSSVSVVEQALVGAVQRLRHALRPDQAVAPLLGSIAAGQYDVTIAMHEQTGDGVVIDSYLAKRGVFALRVSGSSMTHVGIESGDIVVVQPQDSAIDGDFVVATLTDSLDPEGYVTLKEFHRKRDHIFLKSATAETNPIRIYPERGQDRVQVQGVVVAIIKPQQQV